MLRFKKELVTVFVGLVLLADTLLAAGGNTAIGQRVIEFKTDTLEIVTTSGNVLPFKIELAETPAQKARGLMYRDRMAEDAGMLFDYGKPTVITMWMKNTFLPLDMLFIDQAGKIIRIEKQTTPQSLDVISSGDQALAVLEINGGASDRMGINPGDVVRHGLFGNVE